MLERSVLRDKIFRFVGIIIGIVILGVSGYMVVEKWSFIDSLYMTMITISTVGFSEVNGLSYEGKIFTIFLIIMSFGNFALSITSLTRYVVEGEYRRDLRDIKVKRTIKMMNGHVIVAGYGRVGRKVADDLLEQRKKVVVIERDLDLIESLERKVKFQFIPGNATKDEVLKLAGIEKASAIVTCMPNDADNLYVILAALEHNKRINVVARASNNEAVSKLKLAGATHVVMPDSIGGAHMATLIATPLVADFLEKISVTGDHEVNIECIECKDLPPEFQNKKIGMLDAKSITGVNIIGLRTKEGNYIINPASEIELQTGSSIFVLGTEEQIKALNAYLLLN